MTVTREDGAPLDYPSKASDTEASKEFANASTQEEIIKALDEKAEIEYACQDEHAIHLGIG